MAEEPAPPAGEPAPPPPPEYPRWRYLVIEGSDRVFVVPASDRTIDSELIRRASNSQGS